MSGLPRRRVLVLLAGLPLVLTTPALAHHGWAWTIGSEWFELTGDVTEVYVGNPHATLAIDDGETVWHIDLAPLARTLASGFDDTAVAVGESVTVIGHRASDMDLASMKAVRVVAPSGTYDVYPERAAALDA